MILEENIIKICQKSVKILENKISNCYTDIDNDARW